MKNFFKSKFSEKISLGLFFILFPYNRAYSSVSPVANNDDGNMMFILLVLAVVAVMAISVSLVIFWGRKQDEVNHMVFFCIEHLIQTSSSEEKCDAARALAYANNPIALLVLVGVVVDSESKDDIVRQEALESLHIMSTCFSKYNDLISALIPALKENQHEKIITLIMHEFETENSTKYVQSAYLIAKEYIFLEQFEEALEWLKRAQNREHLGEQQYEFCTAEISELINICNEQKYQECDALYNDKQYFEALECYSLMTSGLNESDKQVYLSHLRIACSYCKLKRYDDAKAATLLALQHNQKTDDALRLNDLLHQLENNSDVNNATQELNALTQLDQFVEQMMQQLCAQES